MANKTADAIPTNAQPNGGGLFHTHFDTSGSTANKTYSRGNSNERTTQRWNGGGLSTFTLIPVEARPIGFQRTHNPTAVAHD